MLARARAFVFYFNTERNAVYCVLYVFLLYRIFYYATLVARGLRHKLGFSTSK